MPKVELNDLRLSVSELTDIVYVGVEGKDGSLLHKKDITSQFYTVLEKRHAGYEQRFRNPITDEVFEVSVQKIQVKNCSSCKFRNFSDGPGDNVVQLCDFDDELVVDTNCNEDCEDWQPESDKK